MQSVTVLTVGKIKEDYLTMAIEEYSKRLGRYCKLKMISVKDEATPDNPSENERNTVLKKEGDRLLEKIPNGAYVVPLCIEGKQMSSEAFAERIRTVAVSGKGEMVFVIGGSFGLDDRIKSIADLKLSFSEMTFPHQLMRVVLMEQLYRGFNILNGGKYHK